MHLSRSIRSVIYFLFIAKMSTKPTTWDGKALLPCIESCFFAWEAFSGVALNRPSDSTSVSMLLPCGALHWSRLNVRAFCLILKKILFVFNYRVALVLGAQVLIFFVVQTRFYRLLGHIFVTGSPWRGCPVRLSHHIIVEGTSRNVILLIQTSFWIF